jgi:hypothetical protein
LTISSSSESSESSSSSSFSSESTTSFVSSSSSSSLSSNGLSSQELDGSFYTLISWIHVIILSFVIRIIWEDNQANSLSSPRKVLQWLPDSVVFVRWRPNTPLCSMWHVNLLFWRGWSCSMLQCVQRPHRWRRINFVR